MHSYQHNIKTFNNATRHLTRVERSLYRDLIELYYDTEQPLTAVQIRLERFVLATTEEEKKALKYVLDEFFVLTGDVYTHDYCDEMIESYRANKSQKAKAGKASAEARKKAAEQRRSKRSAKSKQKATDVEQPLNGCATNQEPETINQKPINKKNIYKKIDLSNLPDCISMATARDYIDYRARMGKKAVLVQSSFDLLIQKSQKPNSIGFTPNQVIQECMANGWQGIEISWLENKHRGNHAKNTGNTTGQREELDFDSPFIDDEFKQDIERKYGSGILN